MSLRTKKYLEHFDWVLAFSVLLLLLIGLATLRSVSLAIGSTIHITQIVWVVLGILAAAMVTAFDYRLYDRLAYSIYGFSVLLLVLVLLVGKEVNGSQRWLHFAGLTIQPSELAKISLIIVFAKFFHYCKRLEGYGLRDLFKPIALLLVPVGLTLKEPDLGTSLIMVFIFGTLLAFERIRRQTVWILVIVSILSVPIGWSYALRPYQKTRVAAFLEPELDRLGSGWQSYQSVVAVGSGQIAGKGYGRSTQTVGRFLPFAQTDFIISAYAEEQGFWGVLLLMGLYLFMLFRALRVAGVARDKFGAAIAVGVAAMLFWQFIMNVGMVLHLLPVVGVTFPLMSAGGSSLLATMLGIGLLLNVSMRQSTY